MLSKCANPGCSATFLYLHEGKLFRVFRRNGEIHDAVSPTNGSPKKITQQFEYYWLCDACAARFTVIRSADGTVKAVPLLTFRAAS